MKSLLATPKAPWNQPAITTYRYMNHAVRTEGMRYIRYADGGEELYDEGNDPYEWFNLATKAESAGKKKELGKWLPTENNADIGGPATAGAEEGLRVGMIGVGR
jgi:hypothetical protein